MIHGGCGGNANKFKTKQDCEKACMDPNKISYEVLHFESMEEKTEPFYSFHVREKWCDSQIFSLLRLPYHKREKYVVSEKPTEQPDSGSSEDDDVAELQEMTDEQYDQFLQKSTRGRSAGLSLDQLLEKVRKGQKGQSTNSGTKEAKESKESMESIESDSSDSDTDSESSDSEECCNDDSDENSESEGESESENESDNSEHDKKQKKLSSAQYDLIKKAIKLDMPYDLVRKMKHAQFRNNNKKSKKSDDECFITFDDDDDYISDDNCDDYVVPDKYAKHSRKGKRKQKKSNKPKRKTLFI